MCAYRMTLRPDAAVVTGAAGGIGRVIVEDLLDAGLTVVACDRDGSTTGAERRHPGRFRFHELDITDESAVHSLASALADDGLTVSYLINNAAVQSRSGLADLTTRRWDLVMRVNLLGTFLFTRAFAPAMAARGFGRIVTLSSYYAHRPAEGQSAYAASKAGLVGFTRSVALDHAARGVTANVVSPGLIWHPNLAKVYTREEFETMGADIPTGRTGRPEEVSSAVGYLLSDEAAYITGQVLHVNGGLFLG
ncbi:SDR family NAD(P)-dependent oxidoreductase [Acrocarpospora catenulata]|uniref:SDR family NAD(P)-dependent oxidoreductase n=1 Tax=Acrocarpospora catenulata TaxID=2836182 RepID=UPI001BDB31C2|nr:SDR family oxidoreductase [Acrocarpospora catenulata]